MNRRHLLSAAGVAALATLAQSARAAHEHHAHGSGAAHASPGAYAALVATASDCVATGQVCLAHCIRLLSEGDDSLSDCAKSLNQMLALCGALQNLAAQGAPLVPGLAAVTLQACTSCADACEPHVGHHAECKACYDACQACIKQCKTVS